MIDGEYSERDAAKKNAAIRNAILIGLLTVFGYMLGYYIRKLLGQSRPSILTDNTFSATSLDSFQSIYLIFYAVGQLINGFLGDYLPPKYMVGGGFVLAGISCFIFPATESIGLSLFCFALLGFGLSMLRSPMVKLIIENNPPKLARIVCLFFRFGSYFATWLTTLFLTLFHWREAFSVSGFIMLSTAAVFFISVSGMQKAHIVQSIQKNNEEKKKISLRDWLGIFSVPGLPFYFCISCIVEICNTCITYFLPSYITDVLDFSDAIKNTGMSVFSTLMAFCSFVILFLLKLVKWHDERLMRYIFCTSSLLFLLTSIGQLNPWFKMSCAFLGMLGIGCLSALIWGIFIPGLGKNGKISCINGTLDCFGYCAAALGNLIFSAIQQSFGWTGLCAAWVIVPLIGALIACFRKTPCVRQ